MAMVNMVLLDVMVTMVIMALREVMVTVVNMVLLEAINANTRMHLDYTHIIFS